MACRYGRKKSGGCKRKPGPKKGTKRSYCRKRTSTSRAPWGFKKNGARCKKPGPKRGSKKRCCKRC